MATIKSYADLSQSKTLSKILPLESADMYWDYDFQGQEYKYYPMVMDDQFDDVCIPCWSLAALLDVLPNNKHISTTLSRGGWRIEPIEYIDNWWCEYEDDSHSEDFTVSADNPVNACVAMIIKLYELNLL
jgi:hypothetical protein